MKHIIITIISLFLVGTISAQEVEHKPTKVNVKIADPYFYIEGFSKAESISVDQLLDKKLKVDFRFPTGNHSKIKEYKLKVPGQAALTVKAETINSNALLVINKANNGDFITLFDIVFENPTKEYETNLIQFKIQK